MKSGKVKIIQWKPLVYLIPAFLVYTVFMVIPLFGSLIYGFFKWQGIGEMEFVGFQNYINLFSQYPFNERFFNAFINNLKFFAIVLIFQNVIALAMSVLLCQKLRGMKLFRFVFFLPTTLSVIIVGYLWVLLLNPIWGPVNNVLRAIGLGDLALPWLGNTHTALPGVALANSWQYMGIPMMMFLAAINNIDQTINESAVIDGCTSWNLFRYITLPMLRPTIGMTTVLLFVRSFSAFEIVYAMEGTLADPMYATDIFGTFFYRTLFGQNLGAPQDFGMGAAIAVCMLLFIAGGVGLWQMWDKKINND